MSIQFNSLQTRNVRRTSTVSCFVLSDLFSDIQHINFEAQAKGIEDNYKFGQYFFEIGLQLVLFGAGSGRY